MSEKSLVRPTFDMALFAIKMATFGNSGFRNAGAAIAVFGHAVFFKSNFILGAL
ncbi:MAG: hypothetical protein LBG04_02275 [Holosporaceae bacterium]|jgi:hypothetical protein|nr:hypothetical protein [Holosporaceae bacterium]